LIYASVSALVSKEDVASQHGASLLEGSAGAGDRDNVSCAESGAFAAGKAHDAGR
jgi:hypothetical protein